MRILTNKSNLDSLNHYRKNYDKIQQTMEKLSSGSRINSAKDDAAGLAISERLTKQLKGNNKSIENLQMGIELSNAAESGLQNIESVLQRMRELMIQAGNGTMSVKDRQGIQDEIDGLKDEIDHIAKSTHFNGINLLNNTTIEFEDYQEVTIGAGGSRSFTYNVPAKDPEEGTTLTVTTTNTLTGETINRSMNMTNDDMTKSNTITAPAGYRVRSASVRAVSNGDLKDGDENINLYVNGTYYGQQNSDGDNNTFNLTNNIKGQTSFTLRADKTNTVSDATLRYEVSVVYERIAANTTTVNYNHDLSYSSRTSTWSAPAGYMIDSATLQVNATGNFNSTSKEYTVRVNNTDVAQIGTGYGGLNKTIDITNQVKDKTSIKIDSIDGDNDISYGNGAYTLNVTYRQIQNSNTNYNNTFQDPTKKDTTTIPVPDGMRIASAMVTATASGDLNRAADENVKLYANGGLIGTLNNASGLTATFDATDILQGATALDLEAIKSASVGFANVNWSVQLTYEPTEYTLHVTGANGDTFGEGDAFLTGGESYNAGNTSTVGAYYSQSFPEEKMTFYNPEQGNWTTTIENPSNTHWYKFGVERVYEKATTISIHDQWQYDGRQIIRLANVTNETLGIENISTNDYQTAIKKIDTAIQMVVDERTRFGKYARVFGDQVDYLTSVNVTTSSTQSRISDANIAKETSEMVKAQLLANMSSNMVDKTGDQAKSVLALFQ